MFILEIYIWFSLCVQQEGPPNMFSPTLQKIIKSLNQARGFSCCSALASSKEVHQHLNNVHRLLSPYKTVPLQKKKKVRKKRIVIKRVPDDIEAVWLENLTCSNLKLFRKTSFGSFRKINLENLLVKLKEIYPSEFASESSPVSTPKSVRPSSEAEESPKEPIVESKSEEATASPCLSEYLIKHIIQFPLLKTNNVDSISEFFKMEVEDYGDVDVHTFPSVTGILNDTMSPEARLRLRMWKKKMIQELGEEGFLKYQEDLLTQGSKFHSTLKTYLEVTDKTLVTVPPEIEGCWKSLEKLLPDISDVIFVEESVYHPVLLYKGIVDCVAHYRGVPCVIEWKKSNQIKPQLSSTYDAPLQLCAYLGALPWHKNVTIKSGLVVVAYTNGAPANVFQMPLESCEVYWKEWLRRVQTYWLKKTPTIMQNEV